MSNPKPTHISARRWFDGQNTYHSVCVTFDDGTQAIAPFEYGYGSHYIHTAGKLCGLECPYDLIQIVQDLNIPLDVVDVQRKRDLHHGGRKL